MVFNPPLDTRHSGLAQQLGHCSSGEAGQLRLRAGEARRGAGAPAQGGLSPRVSEQPGAWLCPVQLAPTPKVISTGAKVCKQKCDKETGSCPPCITARWEGQGPSAGGQAQLKRWSTPIASPPTCTGLGDRCDALCLSHPHLPRMSVPFRDWF